MRSNIERRLVYIGDEQTCLSRIGNNQCQTTPGPLWIKRSFVVPGSEQPENFTGKITFKQTIGFIHAPDQIPFNCIEHLLAQVSFKVNARPSLGFPYFIWKDIKIQLVRNGIGERHEEILRRLQMRTIQLLIISKNNPGGTFTTGCLKSSGQQGCFAHLSGTLN